MYVTFFTQQQGGVTFTFGPFKIIKIEHGDITIDGLISASQTDDGDWEWYQDGARLLAEALEIRNAKA